MLIPSLLGGDTFFSSATCCGDRYSTVQSIRCCYLTVWHDEEGRLRFSEDIYGRDEKLKTALEKS